MNTDCAYNELQQKSTSTAIPAVDEALRSLRRADASSNNNATTIKKYTHKERRMSFVGKEFVRGGMEGVDSTILTADEDDLRSVVHPNGPSETIPHSATDAAPNRNVGGESVGDHPSDGTDVEASQSEISLCDDDDAFSEESQEAFYVTHIGRHVWKETALGQTLALALDELVENESMHSDEVLSLLSIFCDVMTDTLPKLTPKCATYTMEGCVQSYKMLYGTWEIMTSGFRVIKKPSAGHKRQSMITANIRIVGADIDAMAYGLKERLALEMGTVHDEVLRSSLPLPMAIDAHRQAVATEGLLLSVAGGRKQTTHHRKR